MSKLQHCKDNLRGCKIQQNTMFVTTVRDNQVNRLDSLFAQIRTSLPAPGGREHTLLDWN